jgi:hypothetical protein
LRFWLGWAQEVAGDQAAAQESWREARSELETLLKGPSSTEAPKSLKPESTQSTEVQNPCCTETIEIVLSVNRAVTSPYWLSSGAA